MDERTSMAYHEAGHAVTAFYWGLPMKSADIVPTEEHDGVVEYDDPPANWDVGSYGEPMAAWYFAQAASTMAGVLAVEMLTGNPARSLDPNTNTLYPGSDWWRLARVSGEVGEDDLQRAYDEAGQVLRENWRAVEAIAEALLEHDALDKDALYAALIGAGCGRDEDAAALVEEAYREQEVCRLLDRRWTLYYRLIEGRDRDAAGAELDEAWREFVLVDNELVESWECMSWLRWRNDGSAPEVDPRGVMGDEDD